MFITLGILSTIGNIALFLFVLGLVICIHELGHFMFAKKAGILCHEFAFGMGPRIWSKKKGETVFSIRAIPFGGFVSMAGEELEAEVIKVGQKIRLGFNDKNEVELIVVNPDDPKYTDLIEVEIEKMDVFSEAGNRLYINEYTVKRDAFYAMGKDKLQIAPKDRSFASKSKKQRFLTTFGGPLMNFILAFVVFLMIGFIGGVPDGDSTVISSVAEDSPAETVLMDGDRIVSINGVAVSTWTGEANSVSSELSATMDGYVFIVERAGSEVTLSEIEPQLIFYGLGFTSTVGTDELLIGSPLYVGSDLEAGDKIISIDGQAMSSWNDVIAFAEGYTEGSSDENPTILVYERDGVEYTYAYVCYAEKVLDTLGYDPFFTIIGISGSNKFSFFGSFGVAWTSFLAAAGTIFGTLGLLFSSSQVGVGDLSGFVGIFSMTSAAAAAGLISLLSWIGLLSVNLGIVNLLPIPALDGGRLVFIGYEAITGRKPHQKFENALHTVMFFLLMGLLIFITFNDIVRLFRP